MTIRDLARCFIRFQGLCFFFFALIELTYFGSAYRSMKTIHEFHAVDSIAMQEFWILVGRVAVQVAAGVFLFGWTDKIINLTTKGIWAKTVAGASDDTK